MILREMGELEGVGRGARMVAPHQFKQCRVHSSEPERANV